MANEKKKFSLYARRNASESWSAWISTDDINALIRQAIVIDACGWQWRVR